VGFSGLARVWIVAYSALGTRSLGVPQEFLYLTSVRKRFGAHRRHSEAGRYPPLARAKSPTGEHWEIMPRAPVLESQLWSPGTHFRLCRARAGPYHPAVYAMDRPRGNGPGQTARR
jgi:hypothetical protein